MSRIPWWCATGLFFGTLVVLLPLVFMSLDKDSRLASLDVSSLLLKYQNQDLIMSTADEDVGGDHVTFTVNNTMSTEHAATVINETKTTNDQSKEAVKEASSSPGLTWLMSFPNSGTSYTMTNTELVSQQSTATNYATEIPLRFGDLVPIPRLDGGSGVDGPWQRNPALPLPSKRVLCKTHCTGYKDRGTVAESVQNLTSFLDGCRLSLQRKDVTNASNYQNRLTSYYKATGLLESAIHLIRDPFDNIISRMHLGMRNQHMTNYANLTGEELEIFMRTKEGAQAWCQEVDRAFWKQSNVSMESLISPEILSLLPYDPTPYLDIPCHGEFFRYTQWHNYAVEIIKTRRIPALVIHYENYGTAYDETLDQIMDFLGQSQVHEPRPFAIGKTYRDFFFENSIQHKVKHLMKEIATEETWELLRVYF